MRPTPRYTATADGTRVRATCQGASKTRQVVTGGAFGGAHAPEVTISFPADECPLGTPLDVWLRFPSGYTHRLSAFAGETIAPVEPAWLSVDKVGPEKGKLLHPEAFNQTVDKSGQLTPVASQH